MVAARVWGKWVMESYYLMGPEFQFCKLKRAIEMEGDNSWMTL